jgi:MinD superfamily P-loop ATPase
MIDGRALHPIHFITINYHCSEFIIGLIEETIASEELDLRFIVVDSAAGYDCEASTLLPQQFSLVGTPPRQTRKVTGR